MKVNVKGVWYDSEITPIQVELSDSDKKNIANMHTEAKNYISYPKELGWEKAKQILKIED